MGVKKTAWHFGLAVFVSVGEVIFSRYALY